MKVRKLPLFCALFLLVGCNAKSKSSQSDLTFDEFRAQVQEISSSTSYNSAKLVCSASAVVGNVRESYKAEFHLIRSLGTFSISESAGDSSTFSDYSDLPNLKLQNLENESAISSISDRIVQNFNGSNIKFSAKYYASKSSFDINVKTSFDTYSNGYDIACNLQVTFKFDSEGYFKNFDYRIMSLASGFGGHQKESANLTANCTYYV